MLKTKKVLKEVEEIYVVDALCNVCGESIDGYRGDETGLHPECVTVNVCWGYWSSKDMTRQQAHICESCWDGFVGQFKIPVSEVDLMAPNCPGADEALQDYEDEYSACSRCGCCAGSHASYTSGGGCSCGSCSFSFEDVSDYAKTHG